MGGEGEHHETPNFALSPSGFPKALVQLPRASPGGERDIGLGTAGPGVGLSADLCGKEKLRVKVQD